MDVTLDVTNGDSSKGSGWPTRRAEPLGSWISPARRTLGATRNPLGIPERHFEARPPASIPDILSAPSGTPRQRRAVVIWPRLASRSVERDQGPRTSLRRHRDRHRRSDSDSRRGSCVGARASKHARLSARSRSPSSIACPDPLSTDLIEPDEDGGSPTPQPLPGANHYAPIRAFVRMQTDLVVIGLVCTDRLGHSLAGSLP